jgi:Outer membrane receptor proteins, mostly Fe transport
MLPLDFSYRIMPLNKTILITRNIILCLLIGYGTVYGQEKKPSASVSLNVTNMPFPQVLALIEKQTFYKFAYSSNLIIKQKKVTLSVQNMPFTKLLAILFKDNTISYTLIGTQVVLHKPPIPKKITISGYVKDGASGESLSGANIYVPALKQSTNANDYSFYSLTIKETDKLDLTVSYEGYEKVSVQVSARKNTVQNFNLVEHRSLHGPNHITKPPLPKNEITDDTVKFNPTNTDKKPLKLIVTIPDSANNLKIQPISNVAAALDLEKAKSSLEDTSSHQSIITSDSAVHRSKKYNWDNAWIFDDMLKTVSSVSGNGDIMNSIQMMPGVMAGLDASTGYFVRGGNTDQNQVQLDEATLYNPTHFFGLVSILNTSAINNGTLLKEGFPAMYGDNLSSILDISMKEGNNHQIAGDLQAGTTASGFTLNGPIVTNKSSYLLSVRRSTMDLWLRPLQTGNDYNNYYFYDVNAKVNYQLSQTDRIYVSLYKGRDNSSYSRDTTDKTAINYGVNFGNQALTLRWNHLYSPKVFSNTTVVYNNYYQSISASQKPYYAQLYSGIRDIDLKTDLNYYPNLNHKISGGISYLFQTLMPASVSDQEFSTGSVITINPSNIPEKHSYRLAVYLGDEMKIGQRLQVYIGARLPLFYNYNTEYVNIEPRLSMLYLTSPSSSIKFTYTQTHQYLHLVKSYNASFPAEIWIGSSKIVKPENSSQATIGLYKNFNSNLFQSCLKIYYKEMGNQLLFKGGVQPIITSNIENTLIFGKGQSYGAELSLRKMKGKLTGWIAYTLSFATQQFDSLNLGQSFPFANDRRNCLYMTAAYALSPHWEISSNLIITSGRAFTLNSVTSVFPGLGKGLYDNESSNSKHTSGKTKTRIEQNNYTLAPYNRLDISVSYKKKKQLARRIIETDWVFSIYNVYARPNTSFAYRTINPVTLLPVVQQVSFFPVIPSITYCLKF